MTSLTKKIVAIVTTVTCAAWMISPGIASALTAEELQAQIATLTAQLATLQSELTTLTGTTAAAGTPAACAGITFTVNLTIGSTGADVQCLQAFLNTNAATQVAATGAGSPGAETMYFGSLTQAAVSKFQANNAISPTAGFVGPITRAKLNELLTTATPTGLPAGCTSTAGYSPTTGVSCATVTPTTPTGGAEGSISALTAATPITGQTIYAGQAEIAINGLNIKAVGSDVLVNRIDIKFVQRPWLYVPKITITDGTNVLATFDVTQASTIEVTVGSNYVVRIEGLNLNIPKDTTVSLVIKADVTLPVGISANTTITYQVLANAVRGIDGAGLTQYAPLGNLTARTFIIARSTVAQLDVAAAADNPLAKAVIISETETTENVEMLRANVKAKYNDAIIRTVVVDLVDANSRIGALKLYDGSTLLAATSTAGSASSTFTDLSLRVNKDTTKTLIVKGDVLATSTEGYAASVSLPVTVTAIVAEDAGDYTTVTTLTGSKASGNAAYFYTLAPSLALVSTEITGIQGTTGSASPQQAQGKIKINVTAQGGDIYVPKYAALVASSGISASATGNTAASPTCTFTSNATEKTNSWLVSSGETKWFEVSCMMTSSGAAAFARAYLTNFKWDISDAAATTPDHNWTWGLETFKTSDIFLQTKG